MMRFAAIDQGTTSTRVLVVDHDQEQLRTSFPLALRHRQIFPRPGWIEHDPLELLGNVRRCIEAAGRIDAIGIANQGESCLAWDAIEGTTLSPVLVWQDDRTAGDLDVLRKAGGEAITVERAGLPLDSYFAASKLSWIVRNLPAATAALNAGRLRLGTTDAYFLDRLTGDFSTDPTTASRTSLMNIRTRQWDPELCALFGVPLEALPPIRDTVGTRGRIGSAPVTCSIVDQQASLYGHGCRNPGDAKITFGTGAFALTLTGEKILKATDSGLLTTLAWQIGETPTYALDGGVYSAGAAVEWVKRLGLYSEFSELASFDMPSAISRGLAFVPALSGLGCPHWDRSASALWIGMTGGTSRQDLCQAMLEGVVLRSVEVLSVMDDVNGVANQLSIDGGLSRSPYFAQFLADCSQRTVITSDFDELTAFGCAALAASALSHVLPLPNSQLTKYSPLVHPDTARQWGGRFAEAIAKSHQWNHTSSVSR